MKGWILLSMFGIGIALRDILFVGRSDPSSEVGTAPRSDSFTLPNFPALTDQFVHSFLCFPLPQI